MNVFISGQKYFGESVLRLCINLGFNVVGVCCPVGDNYIGRLASLNKIKVIPAGSLNYASMPDGVDVGITAHSFDYIGRLTRYKPRLGWLGYHPSLLPIHRGRSSIEWAVRMRERVTGGTIFWLNAGIDRGDIERQTFILIDPKYFSMCPKKAAAEIWRGKLCPLGVKLYSEALKDISAGIINKTPQNKVFSTWEPSTSGADIYRPDSLMIPQKT